MTVETILISGVVTMAGVVSFLAKIIINKWNASDKERKEELSQWKTAVIDKIDVLIKTVGEGNMNHRLLELKVENLSKDHHELKEETKESIKNIHEILAKK